MLTDPAGLPRAVAASAAHTPDHLALTPLAPAVPALGARRGLRRRRPAKLHAEDYEHLRAWLGSRCIAPRIAHRGSSNARWPG